MQKRLPGVARRFFRQLAAASVVAAGMTLPLALAGQDAAPGTGSAQAAPAGTGPEWTVVQDYLEANRARTRRMIEIARAEATDEERSRLQQESWDQRPDIGPAIAAAAAIVDVGPAHDRMVDAAEFLLTETDIAPDAGRHMRKGAQALIAHAPARWRRTLRSFARGRFFGQAGQEHSPVQAFFEEMAFRAGEPATRGAFRYYLADGMRRSANFLQVSPPPDGRDALRRRAIEVATGLSAGLEEQEFYSADEARRSDWPGPRTFAHAEADLLWRLRHATVGGVVSELTGRRLDGVEDRLSTYAGRVVLIDFWATWCPPCVQALPALRALVADLPRDRFTFLAISVDEALETIDAFQQEHGPLPGTNWHAGDASDITRLWDVWIFPTYVLVDAEGVILGETHDLDDEFMSLIREAVEGSQESAP